MNEIKLSVGYQNDCSSFVSAEWDSKYRCDVLPLFNVSTDERALKKDFETLWFAAHLCAEHGLKLNYQESLAGRPEEGQVVLSNAHMIISIYHTHKRRAASLSIQAQGVDGLVAATKIRQMFLDNTTKKETQGSVYMMIEGSGGPSFMEMPRKVESPLEEGNYASDVLEGFRRIKADLDTPKPHGRIALFDGPPGTGKTHLLKSLLTECTETVFVLVSPDLLLAMTGPSVLPALLDFSTNFVGSSKSITFLVEDADSCVAPRGADNMSVISGVLNLGDGILGQLLDIRLVMTTNAKHSEIDEAILRPGRLSARVNVDKLDADQCNQIYNRLTGTTGQNPFDKRATLAEVYGKAMDSGFKPVPAKSMGFDVP